MATKKNAFKPPLLSLAAIALALAFTAGSVLIQSVGPEMSVAGNLCGSASDQFCYAPTLKGGFPFAYLYDTLGLSVEHKLSLEDEFKAAWFIADWLIYLALIVFTHMAIKRILAAIGFPDYL